MYNIDSHGVMRKEIEGMLSEFSDAKKWLESSGVKVSAGRFQRYSKIIENKYFDSTNTKANSDEDVLWALAELHDLLEIYSFLKNVEMNQIRSVLRHVNSGPALLADEKNDGGSIHGRNFSFELYMAARIMRSGINVSFNTEADIDFLLNDSHLKVECKRIVSENNIEKLISKAFDQIDKRCSQTSDSFGLVALSISKLIWKIQAEIGQGFYAEIQTIQNYFAKFSHDFSYDLRKIYENRTPNALGIIFHYKVPFFRMESGYPAFINRFSFVPFTKQSYKHKQLSILLSGGLKASVYQNG